MGLIESYLFEVQEKSISISRENPNKVLDEFSTLWIDHINYVNSIQNFPYKKANKKLFTEKFNKSLRVYPNSHTLFTARDNDKLVGYVQVGITQDGGHGQIISFHFLKDYRGEGLGSKLIKEALNWLWKNGAKEIELGTQGGNEAAVSFYKKHGFKIQGYTLRHEKSKY